MKHVYVGAIELINDKIQAVGIMIGRATDPWNIHSLQERMKTLHMRKHAIIQRSGLFANVITVDFQAKRKIGA